MASFATACRLSQRLAARQNVVARGYRTSAKCLAAQNFTMPALSPTMTEGNIATWKVKEGDSFSAGDVLLEIETDKASMDVEAQDDGIVAKILQGDGSKNIQVGARIGVLAEPGDDLSSLKIPAEDSSSAPSPKEEASKPNPETTSESQAEAPPTSKPSSDVSAGGPTKSTSGGRKKQTYPLLPSVEHLLKNSGLSHADVDKMTPSGPNGRLLKGDVLAYIGSISSSYPTSLSAKISKLSHLDLSNIKLAPPPAAPKAAAPPAPQEEAAPPKPVSVALPISMQKVLEVQQRIHKTLGVWMPLETFVARAAELANDDLPRAKNATLSAGELFNQVLGLDKVGGQGGVRGNYVPQISSLSVSPATTKSKASKQTDIIDILSGKSRPVAKKSVVEPVQQGFAGTTNVFSLSVPKGEVKRAEVFLGRVKTVLESEPGRLVL